MTFLGRFNFQNCSSMDHSNLWVAGNSLPPMQPSRCFQNAMCALTLRTNPALHGALCPLLRVISCSLEQRWG